MNRKPELAMMDAPSTQREGAAPRRLDDAALDALVVRIKAWGRELGFGAIGISDTDLSDAEAGLAAWLEAGCHGEMDYMAKHGMKRARPAELVAGTLRVISARLAYLPGETAAADAASAGGGWRARELARLEDPAAAVVSIYARGRDYHKVLRNRLQTLAERIEAEIGPFGYRVFTDSAPVLEVELAQKAGTGWRGKHTLLLQRDAGSLFFLGEIFVDLPLPTDAETSPATAPETPGSHCGSCTRCIDACPTGAIVEPFRVDARRCISYLTIELKGSIPESLRPLIGNRVYGCDDCQLVCPWNKFAQPAPVADFDVRHGLGSASLVDLFGWSAEQFDERMQGSAIRRIGHERWLRNLAVGLGNALRAPRERLGDETREAIVAALAARADDASELVREHVEWALQAA
ncbi:MULTISPECIES: tRNA epoxyqueuosine(34) reductase QueG [unclassified Burkholderia]|uniref:tRNA epoxyqueuosine(34) reductase QueG n=1 Tax=unclassified Burkholderia TaxID=2613784 RepID=UPI001421C9BD|nr:MULTISPECIES: tRNA epoxyqueuosine(34) reductase QueG [unclassified Burkholderia]NIE85242.1 tRNA epoxyqueuosine(34) reductase QueG [Burkholderia sp. Tr-860]NIF65010.1 tRNA epoxyqueuosine(34) reductase QueG [Burkholderia sp. Cy-647]NIF99961.1 tRNA epoxyqueuosine(34) reductase QueG [Burkholderia sp. Ax-1720]